MHQFQVETLRLPLVASGACPSGQASARGDPNRLAKLITDIATGEVEDKPEDTGKNPAAVELGRKGGLKGGKARAESMTPEQRSEAAKKAARARWARDS